MTPLTRALRLKVLVSHLGGLVHGLMRLEIFTISGCLFSHVHKAATSEINSLPKDGISCGLLIVEI